MINNEINNEKAMLFSGIGRRPTLDIIVPLYNEAEMVDILVERLREVFSDKNLECHGIESVQYIIVDDGSTDLTALKVTSWIDKGLPINLYRLSRNFGHQNALCAGIDRATSDIIAIIDGDLQDPPEVILEMVAKWREGYDVVRGRRLRRKEHFIKRWCYWSFYRLVALLSEINMPLDSGDFCLIDRKVLAALKIMPERLRFLRGLRSWVGFRQVDLSYERPLRYAGQTKYPWSKLYRLATDGIASTSIKPLQLAQVFSFSFFVLCLLLSITLIFNYSSFSPAWLLCYILILGSSAVNTLCLYILGAYIGRTYLEVKQRPSYILMEIIEQKKGDMQ